MPPVLAQRPLRLFPLTAARLGNTVPGLAVVGLGVGVANPVAALSGPDWCAVVTTVAVGSALAVRGYRMGVVCTTTTVIVQGFFRTRTIPRSAIVDVTDFPSARWRDGNGRIRRSPAAAFATLGNTRLADVEDHRRECVRLLRKTLRGRRRRYPR